MNIRTKREGTGRYYVETRGGRIRIEKGRNSWRVTESQGLTRNGVACFDTKKHALAWLGREHKANNLTILGTYIKENKDKEREHLCVSDSTIRRKLRETNAGLASGPCVPLAFARVLADDPSDSDEVANLAILAWEIFVQNGIFRGDAFYGGMDSAAKALGISDFRFQKEELDTKTGFSGGHRYNVRTGYPTFAQWERNNPHVTKGVVRGTGHAAYMERDADGTAIVYGMGARKRIDHAVILETNGEGS